jgi:hypothetical protein
VEPPQLGEDPIRRLPGVRVGTLAQSGGESLQADGLVASITPSVNSSSRSPGPAR